MKIKEYLEPIIAVGVVVGLVMASLAFFAKAEDVAQIKKSVDYHIADQQREALEQRLDKLKEKYKSKSMPEEAREMKKDLEKRMDEKDKELKQLEKK